MCRPILILLFSLIFQRESQKHSSHILKGEISVIEISRCPSSSPSRHLKKKKNLFPHAERVCWVRRCVIPGLSAGGCLHIDSESMFGLQVSGHNTAFAGMDTLTEPNQQVAPSSANKPAWWAAASLGVMIFGWNEV